MISLYKHSIVLNHFQTTDRISHASLNVVLAFLTPAKSHHVLKHPCILKQECAKLIFRNLESFTYIGGQSIFREIILNMKSHQSRRYTKKAK